MADYTITITPSKENYQWITLIHDKKQELQTPHADDCYRHVHGRVHKQLEKAVNGKSSVGGA